MRSLRIVNGVFSLLAGLVTILSVILIVKTVLVFPSAEFFRSFVLNRFSGGSLEYKIVNVLMLIFASVLIIFSFAMYAKKYNLGFTVILIIASALIVILNILIFFITEIGIYENDEGKFENYSIFHILSISISFISFVLSLFTIIFEKNKNMQDTNVGMNAQNKVQHVPMSNHNLLRENEDSVDLHSKLNRLRSSLNKKANEFTEDSSEVLDKNVNEPVNIVEPVQEANIIKNTEPVESVVIAKQKETKPQFDNSIKDPYKQTIVPRRAGVSNHFDRPIGNIKQEQPKQIKNKRPELDDSYKNKVFIEDSDRIWDALKQQERPGINTPLPEAQINNVNNSDEYKRNQAAQLNEPSNNSVSENSNNNQNSSIDDDNSDDSQFSIDWGED